MNGNSNPRLLAPALLGLAVAALINGCGGGGGSGSGMSANTAPTITAISAQTINQGTSTAVLTFTVGDDGGADAVTLSAASSNGAIVPTDAIVLGGSGARRTLQVTPDESGTGLVRVVLFAKDAQGLVTNLIVPLNIMAVQQSVAGFTASTFALMENDTPAIVTGITFVQDADDENTFNPLLQ